ncbi:MAG: dihydroorotase [Rickettsiales bacterium]|nr:dihydroorotase [Rickettsiales bacterium]
MFKSYLFKSDKKSMSKEVLFNFDKKTAKDFALLNGKIILPNEDRTIEGGLLIKDKIIYDFGEHIKENNISENFEKIDCNNLLVCPGLVDMRAQIREPGFEHQETMKSISKSATSGGITSLVCMPNTFPVIDQPALIQSIQRKAREVALTKIFCTGCITRDLLGKEICELQLMHESGALGFTDAIKSVSNARVMKRAFTYVKSFDGLIMQHPEENNLSSDGVMNEGEVSTRLGLKGIPYYAEAMIIERDLWIVRETGARYHINHVSTSVAVEIIRKAKKEGLNVTCDTAPPYFMLNEMAIENYRTFAKLSPPLRTESDRLAIIQGLQDGTIDAIVSDHTPQDQDAKRLPFNQAEYGAVGLETLLPLTLSLVKNGSLKIESVLSLVTNKPANILGLKSGVIGKGLDADLIVLDENKPWKIEADNFLSKSKNTPFDGLLVEGKNLMTFIKGRLVFKCL